jgi:threonylcarbamoyladenosine tRNA methylthiotransferase MtaB
MNKAIRPHVLNPTAVESTEIITFGCRLNAYESEVIRRNTRDAGLEDTIIVNTCAVTKEAERQARQAIRKARRRNGSARLVVTGCAAQINPGAYAEMPEVDQVLGNTEKLEARSFGAPSSERIVVNDIMSVGETAGHLIEGFEGRARAFLQVQNGCDHRCTFCIIPFGRGNSRSVPAGEVVEQARMLGAAGYREVVLSGVDIGAYGADLPGQPTLGKLVSQVLHHAPDLTRLRLSSIDVAEVDDALFELVANEPRVMPHLHLSLQSGDNMILKRMKRRHTRGDAIRFCERLREHRPGIVFGADLIAGFPTETEAMFENTLRLIDDCGLTYLHVFPYSARPETPAARMAQLPAQVRKERAAHLRTTGQAALIRHLDACVGTTVSALVEHDDIARSEHYAPIRLDRAFQSGQVISAKVEGHDGTRLIARAIDG